MEMLAIPVYSAIRYSQFERPLQPESNYGIPWNPHLSPPRLAASDGTHNAPDYAVIPPLIATLLDMFRFRFDAVWLAIYHHRIQVQDEVISGATLTIISTMAPRGSTMRPLSPRTS
jgi:hypothetical protein